MNKVILMGRLARDPEVIYSNNGNAVARFTLAVNRKIVGADGVDVDFIQCVTFGKTAEFVEKYFKKGVMYGACGRIVTRSYEKDGTKHYVTEVAAEEVYFCEKRREDPEEETPKKQNKKKW